MTTLDMIVVIGAVGWAALITMYILVLVDE